ncbi:MAG: magnesium transporter, partial [Candidatus Pacearchaeota archaeon]|nr:magnesium transporter [Candidatus Pacearchaeota archaeon]
EDQGGSKDILNRRNNGHHKHFKFRILGKSSFERHRDFYEILFSEIISMTGGLIAGLILLNIKNSLEFVPAFLVFLPGFLELHGNLFGSLAARLSVALHLKKMKPKLNHSKIFVSNVMATGFLGFVLSLILGVIAFFLTKVVFGFANLNIIFIALAAMLFSLVIEIPITSLTVF